MNPKRRDDLNDDEIVRRYQAGESIRRLGKVFNVHRDTIGRRVDEANVSRRGWAEATNLQINKLTEEERKQRVAKAVEASRNKPRTEETLVKIAQTRESREQSNTHISPVEHVLLSTLRAHGFHAQSHHAVGRYVVDIVVGTMCVEVLDSRRKRSSKISGSRLRYLMTKGYSVIYIWTDYRGRTPLPMKTIQLVLKTVQTMRKYPTTLITYCVINKEGEKLDVGTINEATFSVIPKMPRRGS